MGKWICLIKTYPLKRQACHKGICANKKVNNSLANQTLALRLKMALNYSGFRQRSDQSLSQSRPFLLIFFKCRTRTFHKINFKSVKEMKGHIYILFLKISAMHFDIKNNFYLPIFVFSFERLFLNSVTLDLSKL